MQHFECDIPVAAKLMTMLDTRELLRREVIRLMRANEPLSFEDVGRILGPDAIYISGTGADPVILQTVGSSYEVGRRLIEVGKLLCEEHSN